MDDATAKLLARFKNPKEWDHIDYNVPIFIEHELWETDHPFRAGKKVHVAILPGDEKPKSGTMLYSIGTKELLTTAAKINAALNMTANTVGVFIGHRNQSKPEDQQPKLVGHGVGAKVGTFGPKQIKAVLLDKIYYAKGNYEEAKTYPHRSPEFKPLTGQLTGLALLKNDPKLPMGMMTYKDMDTVCYGPFPPGEGESKSSGSATNGEIPTSIRPKGTEQDPTKPPTAAEPDQIEHERWKVNMEHYKRTDPMMLQMCKNYETECASAIAPEEGAPPIEEPGKEGEPVSEKKEEKKEPKVDMADDALVIQYKALTDRLDAQDKANKDLSAKLDTLATVNQNLTVKYAQSEATRIEARLASIKVIKDRAKLRAKLAATDDVGRKAIFDDIIENYADLPDVERDPSKAPEIEVYEGHVEGGEEKDPVIDEMDMSAAVQYAEQNKLDFATDYVKIYQAIAKKNGAVK